MSNRTGEDRFVTFKSAHVVGKRCRSLVAFLWLFAEALQANRFQILWNARIELRRPQRFIKQQLANG